MKISFVTKPTAMTMTITQNYLERLELDQLTELAKFVVVLVSILLLLINVFLRFHLTS